MGRSLAFTGHHTESLSIGDIGENASQIQLRAMLLDEIMSRAAQGYDTFYCSAERGIDAIFGDLVLWVKVATFPELRLICVIPHEEQATRWPEEWRDRYYKLLDQADDMVLISHRYTSSCCHQRDQYMVDHANTLLAVYDGCKEGDVAYTVDYAKSKGREIVVINPDTRMRTDIPPRLEAL